VPYVRTSVVGLTSSTLVHSCFHSFYLSRATMSSMQTAFKLAGIYVRNVLFVGYRSQ